VTETKISDMDLPYIKQLIDDVTKKIRLELIGYDQAELAAELIEELFKIVITQHNLINVPHTEDYFEAVKLEAAHQIQRWGSEHDEGKTPDSWFWLLGRLSGKALTAFLLGDNEKGKHHIISSSAMLLNWHRNVTGDNTSMRPGIDLSGKT
jgi:hypothetical protein